MAAVKKLSSVTCQRLCKEIPNWMVVEIHGIKRKWPGHVAVGKFAVPTNALTTVWRMWDHRDVVHQKPMVFRSRESNNLTKGRWREESLYKVSVHRSQARREVDFYYWRSITQCMAREMHSELFVTSGISAQAQLARYWGGHNLYFHLACPKWPPLRRLQVLVEDCSH